MEWPEGDGALHRQPACEAAIGGETSWPSVVSRGEKTRQHLGEALNMLSRVYGNRVTHFGLFNVASPSQSAK